MSNEKSSNLDNGQKLRALIEQAQITQPAALKLFNEGQVRQLSLGQWKAYLSSVDSARRSPCPDAVLEHMAKVLQLRID